MIRSFYQLCLLAFLCLAVGGPVAAQTLSILYNFQGDAGSVMDGARPNALILGTDGNFYGTTQEGGYVGNGTVFKITPTGVVTLLYKFGNGPIQSDGADPFAALVLGNDGNFYGTTLDGGFAGYGTVFKITSSGTETVLHRFSDGTLQNDGATPASPLVLGPDRNFYGTTNRGGTAGYGTVYKITPAGGVTILHSFRDGSVPNDGSGGAQLVVGPDGNLYGTSTGGSTGAGVFFRMTLSGTETVLHNFGDGTNQNDGSNPNALVLGPDGNFYGTTQGGGNASQEGTIFKMTLNGTETVLHRFGTNGGASPSAALVLGPDGDFYGSTDAGGVGNNGTLYKITVSGNVTVLHEFGDGTVPNDGSGPVPALILGTDGNFYGTTVLGGSASSGNVFRLVPSIATTWSSKNVAAATDGTARMLWVRSDGAAGVWSFNAADQKSTVGPAYGPYADGYNQWAAQSVKVASDGTARLLWARSDGAASLWTLNAGGTKTAVGPTYGPYSGWTATDLATAPDGTSRILWTRSDGAAGIWTLNASGTETKIGPTYGPYSGWTAQAIGAARDGSSRILWNNSDGLTGVWTLDTNDAVQSIGPSYGPYHAADGLWVGMGIGISPNGQSQVLWTNPDRVASLWTFSSTGVEVSEGPTYGPYTGWTPTAMDSVNAQARVLWVRSDRAAGVWTFSANDTESVIGSVYGPF